MDAANRRKERPSREDRSEEIVRVLRAAKRIAKRYYALTGRPLGCTGEIAEYEAIRLLGLRPAEVRQSGYDAEGKRRDGRREQLQIKGRCIVGRLAPGARMGAIDTSKPWDAVLLVLLDADFDATAIYRAERDTVCEALSAPGSKARNERGQLAISKFKQIGRRIWPREA